VSVALSPGAIGHYFFSIIKSTITILSYSSRAIDSDRIFHAKNWEKLRAKVGASIDALPKTSRHFSAIFGQY